MSKINFRPLTEKNIARLADYCKDLANAAERLKGAPQSENLTSTEVFDLNKLVVKLLGRVSADLTEAQILCDGYCFEKGGEK